ncbi:hypothetical protein C5B42_01695 [Candidatus Cerribacteria bacterium 'Amazon FNV 2010 28 9']|uniref:Uncharacterized protein n=1 Tax=Candidatus Cerribacteria bacterium 'Amazon FNV 2010 28 9' TaxID=2081795 RepID=A0A317JPZ8_9BACT|nr:MAG: hypothetical protein C5B42_01695 [Candidatus Cerribacteria bacterium 'Amazon FNV 2010 28 9']
MKNNDNTEGMDQLNTAIMKFVTKITPENLDEVAKIGVENHVAPTELQGLIQFVAQSTGRREPPAKFVENGLEKWYGNNILGIAETATTTLKEYVYAGTTQGQNKDLNWMKNYLLGQPGSKEQIELLRTAIGDDPTKLESVVGFLYTHFTRVNKKLDQEFWEDVLS